MITPPTKLLSDGETEPEGVANISKYSLDNEVVIITWP